MPRLPSASSTVSQRPSPGSWSNTDRHSARAPRDVVRSTAALAMSTPSTGWPRWASAAASRPGPQPTSRVAPVQRSSIVWSTTSAGRFHRSSAKGSSCPPLATSRSARPVRTASSYRCNAGGSMPRWPTVANGSPSMRANAAANRVPGHRRATERASASVSTSVNTGSSATVNPASVSRNRCAAPVVGVLMGTPAKTSARGCRMPIPQNPPSCAIPRTASLLHRSTSSSSGVSCGVSMPTRNAGPSAAANAAANRSARPPPTCGTTSMPAGSHGPGRPSSTRTRRSAGAAATASSVSARHAAARSAAAWAPTSAASRVFTLPGNGSLAMTSNVRPLTG